MSHTSDGSKTKSHGELEAIIGKAMKKVGGDKENDLCKYIPMESGGYMHHFTLSKMKRREPGQLLSLIEKFIISPSRPAVIPPKQRAPRGTRKRRDNYKFSRQQLERLVNMARLAGDTEMISLLSPQQSLRSAKRELIQSIRQGVVNHELWNRYVESVNAEQMISATLAAQNLSTDTE